ncbi:DNA cytosine methyltransferase [Aliagarivorans taiwanensis]|uniref:DNA cytosine methyltransferase n=1 Tax=Aliagarivorans taiwanensis TaxID=561966 RepID=UPI000479DB94|nr:DNA cytosine methyltransferase [Aliagarivorans taiwanensis]
MAIELSHASHADQPRGVHVAVNVPSLATKQLKIKRYPDGKRKIVCSSNWLPLFAFFKGTPVVEEFAADRQALIIRLAEPAETKVKTVYGRHYPRRRNNPFETLVQVASQTTIDKVFPKDCEYVHVAFTHGRLVLSPLKSKLLQRLRQFMGLPNKKSVFAVCSSGMDATAAEEAGWTVQAALDFRPNERRDISAGRDLTETGLLNLLANVAPQAAFNEDIYTVDPHYIKRVFGKNTPALMTISLQCSDFSNVKSSKAKLASELDLSSTLDMAYPGLRMVEVVAPPMVLLEQVTGFGRSPIGRLWDLTLRRLGYQTYQAELDPREHGGLTSRNRFFSFATSLPAAFAWPKLQPVNTTPLWDTIIKPRLHELRDVTANNAMQEGLKRGFLRCITPDSCHAPTILKSQPRQAKDSVVIKTNETPPRLLWPSEGLLKDLMGATDSFSVDSCATEVASQIIGQGVDMPEYRQIMSSITAHVEESLAFTEAA